MVGAGFNITEHGIDSEGKNGELVLPRLIGKGVRKVLSCEILEEVDAEETHSHARSTGLIRVGDHVLVMARVKDIIGDSTIRESESYGLSYTDGRYRRVGEVLDL